MLKQMSGRTFSNLLSYYIACLEQEDMLSVTFKVSSEGTAFLSTLFQTELLFHSNNKQVMAKNTEGIKKFFQTSLLQRNNKHLFYGYPVVIGPQGTISPLFFIEVQYEVKDDMFILTNDFPRQTLNHYLLSKNNFSSEEILHIQQQIEGETFSTALHSICTTLDLDNSECTPTLDEKPFKRTIVPKLLNKAIIYFGERTDITRNLITELHQLQKKPLDELASSALLLLLTGEFQPEVLNHISKPLLEIFTLNPAQEYAVKHALIKPLTVITGPPGTGKTQVVLNLISNAVYQNKTVLFASKNNKAVDVVTEKLNILLPYKLLVRMGNQTHRSNAKTEIEHLIEQRIQKIPFKQEIIYNLENIGFEIASVTAQINNLKALNESLGNMQTIYNSLRELYTKGVPIQKQHVQLDMIDPVLLEKDLHSFFKKRRMLQRLHTERYNKKQNKCFQKYYNALPPDLKIQIQTLINNKHTTKDAVLNWILSLKKQELALLEIQKIKQSLLSLPSYSTLTDLLFSHHTEYTKKSRYIFIQHWINKFAEADDTDTHHMKLYFCPSEQLDSKTGEKNNFQQLYQKRLQALQRILKFLPVWIVTNLSVKQSLPLKNNLFDILIIDEASQCDIASAIPLFYRAKHVVIIGDPHQLKHISLLTENQDRSLADNLISTAFFNDLSYTIHSLYDLADHILQNHGETPLLLNEHYRCHQDIVSFSNEYYYGRKLTIATDEKKLLHHPSLHTRILWHHIKGKTIPAKSPYNEIEAERIVEEILRLLEVASSTHASIGIVSLFRAQTQIIAEKLKKFKDVVDTQITIGTAHRFQGDEKDIVLFSPVVSDGVKNGTLQWIRTTSQLLNVAVTRARSLFIIVGDKEVCTQTNGPLKNLSDYVEMTRCNTNKLESSITKLLHTELKNQSIPIIPHYILKGSPSPTVIDFALFVNSNRYAILIREEDERIDTKKFYESGWKIRRFSEEDIRDNLTTVVEEIKRLC